MRPVNLIPSDERRGERAPLRSGSLAYVLVAGLAVAVAAASAVVLTGNSIKESEAEVAALEAREAAAVAEAESLRRFADFASLSQAREETVASLAQSRFDWERVLRELALVIPEDIWLTQLSGMAAAGVQVDNAADVALQAGVTGPSLAMTGCGTSHDAVAAFLQTLKDIDGITRVGIASSERAEQTPGSVDSGAASAGTGDCRTRDFIVKFEIVAAFDEVPLPGTVTTPAPETDPAAAAASDASGVADAKAQKRGAADSTAEQTREAKQAVNLVPGVVK